MDWTYQGESWRILSSRTCTQEIHRGVEVTWQKHLCVRMEGDYIRVAILNDSPIYNDAWIPRVPDLDMRAWAYGAEGSLEWMHEALPGIASYWREEDERRLAERVT